MENRTNIPSAEELLTHAAFVRGLALAIVGDAHEADEVTQETYLRALERPPTVLGNARAWLAGVARNVIRMRHRTESRRRRREGVAARPDHSPSTADSVARMEVLRRLTEAVADLDEPYRTTMLLRYYDRQMPAEIARNQDVPVKTVKTRLHRGLERLRGRLDAQHRDRRAWALLLLPAGTRMPLGLTPIAAGAVIMTMTMKLTLAAVAVLAIAATAITMTWSGEPSDPAGTELAKRERPGAEVPPPGGTEIADAAPPKPAVPVVADPEPTPTDEPRTPRCLVRAKVVDAKTGDPIPGVVVHRHHMIEDGLGFMVAEDEPSMWVDDIVVDRLSTIRALSDEKGQVAIPATAGPHVLVVRHARYRDWIGKRFALAKGDEKDLEIRLVAYPATRRELRFGGVVTDGRSGEPLAGVSVVCLYLVGNDVETTSVETGADGRYVLAVPINAPLDIRYGKAGYEQGRLALNPVHRDWIKGDKALLAIGGGPERGHGRIAGLVVDEASGKPVSGVALTLHRGLDENGRGGIGSWGGFGSGKDGRYRIDLKPVDDKREWIRIVANHPGYQAYRSGLLGLAPDQISKFRVVLVPAVAETAFVGTVTDAESGKPVPGASVHSKDIWENVVGHAVADAEGRFRLAVRGGEDELVIRAPGFATGKKDVREKLGPGSGETLDCSLALIPATARIAGTVRDAATGEPLGGATLTIFYAPPGCDDDDSWYGPGPVAVSDARGGYSFDLAPGRYLVRAKLPGYGSRCSRPVDASANRPESADIALRTRNCILAGVVRNATTGEAFPKGAEDVRVLRIPRNAAEEIECRMSGHDGPIEVKTNGARFEVALPPGKWLVLTDPRGYFRVRREIVLNPGDRHELDFELEPVPPPTATLRGAVLREGTKAPVPGARVEIRMKGLRLGVVRGSDQGRFEVACPAGELLVKITIRLPSGEPVVREKTVTTRRGALTEVEILFPD